MKPSRNGARPGDGVAPADARAADPAANPPTETVTSLYAFVERHQDRIVDYCIDSERMLWPGMPEPALRGTVEALLGQLLSLLHAEGIRGHQHDRIAGTLHGRWAFAGGIGILTIIRELGLITEAICAVAARHSLAFAAREYQALNGAIIGSISTAVTDFLRAHHEHDDGSSPRAGIAVETRNAVSAARVAYDALRSGTGAVSSPTADTLGMAISRLERLGGDDHGDDH